VSTALIYGQEERLLPWAARVIGCERFRRDAYCIGLEKQGELVAVVVFDDFTKAGCHMSVASDGSAHWLSRGYLAALFAYPFLQLKLRRVTALIAQKNERSRSFCEHIGFRQEGVCPHGLPDDDLIIMGMLAGECRYLPRE
jgi:RimJ/RimL family protein N-acetyltransferase